MTHFYEANSSCIHHSDLPLSETHESRHDFPSSLYMSASVGLVLLSKEPLHHPLLLELNLLYIHRILSLIINGLKLQFEAKLKLFLGFSLVQVDRGNLRLILNRHSILKLLHLLICLMNVHVYNVHLSETLQDFPEEVVLELVIGLDIEFFKEVVLCFLVFFIDFRIPSKGLSQFQ